MLSNFPRYPLTFGPTPIEHLSRLTKHLGGAVDIYAKREDCNSGLAFGGNKLRKLEYIVPDAIASNADTLVSIGGVQSNHTRMVAAVAAKLGMKCLLIQESWVPHEDAVYDRVGNILLSRLMGAETRLVDVSNQFWLWCLPAGDRIPAGFTERAVEDARSDPRFPAAHPCDTRRTCRPQSPRAARPRRRSSLACRERCPAAPARRACHPNRDQRARRRASH